MQDLISDIKKDLKKNKKIRGFSQKRLEDLIANEFDNIQGYELRILIRWSGLYVFQFEEKYGVTIED